MSTEENVQIVKDFFAAMGNYNEQDLLALVAEGIEWVIPGEGWPLAGTHRGHAGLVAALKKASEEVGMNYPKPPEFVGQGNRVFVVGVANETIKATNKPFKDESTSGSDRSAERATDLRPRFTIASATACNSRRHCGNRSRHRRRHRRAPMQSPAPVRPVRTSTLQNNEQASYVIQGTPGDGSSALRKVSAAGQISAGRQDLNEVWAA